MKTVTVILMTSVLIMGASPFMRDENHKPPEIQKEEQTHKDIHKPGELSDSYEENQLEEKQKDKDVDPDYEPIDDEIKNTGGDLDLKGYPIQ